jgi:hypothetical protein
MVYGKNGITFPVTRPRGGRMGGRSGVKHWRVGGSAGTYPPRAKVKSELPES